MLNPFKDINWNPGLVEKREFGMSLIIGFPCLALFFTVITWLRTHTWQPGFMWIGAIGLVAIVTFLRAEIGPRPVAGATGGAQPAVAVSPRERPGAERVRGTAGS